MTISQGDQYGIPVTIKVNGELATPDMFSNVEIVIGNIRKDLESGVTYSADEQAWIFPVTQEETIRLAATKQKAQARVKFAGGNVYRASLGEIDLESSISKVVL